MDTCLKLEMEHRMLMSNPHWYLVQTTYHNNGEVSASFVLDESTGEPVVISGTSKPLDGVYEGGTYTTYYTYHQSWQEADWQIRRALSIALFAKLISSP